MRIKSSFICEVRKRTRPIHGHRGSILLQEVQQERVLVFGDFAYMHV